jgi:PAS domain S-box-containing protein
MLKVEQNEALEELNAASEAFTRSVHQREGSLDWLPIGVCVCDRVGRLTRFNRRAAALWGFAPKAGDEIFKIEADLRAADQKGVLLTAEDCPMGRALRTGEPVNDAEITMQRPDGSKVILLANVDPLFDESGRLVGAVKCFQDITEKKENEQRVRQGARTIRSLIDALPGAIYTTDPEGRITFFNRSAVKLWGREPSASADRWCGSHQLFNAEGEPLAHENSPMAIAHRTGEPIRDVECILERPNGERVRFMSYPTPIHDQSGLLVGAVNMLVDTSEVHRLNARQKILIDELNHRVKNTLATVQALALQTFPRNERPEAVDAFLARLLALSKAHDHLTRDHWESAELAALLNDVLRHLEGVGERIQLYGPPLRIAPRVALTLAMTFNELATNAMKYGALSNADGAVTAAWRTEGEHLLLHWRESGGPPVAPVERRGFGTRMIQRGIESELGGKAELRFAPEGLECDLALPLAALV